MESMYTELALYGSKNECARTDNVFSPISEVCYGAVSLVIQRKEVKHMLTILTRQKGGGGGVGPQSK